MSAQKCTLLVVDDEPYILPTLQALLAADFEVFTADSAAAAQSVFAHHTIDLILSDQKMPGCTGVQLLEWVREHYPRTVRILMTGYAELDATVEAINRGHVYHYLLKPWRTEELLQVLRNAAEKRQLERSRDQLLREVQAVNRDLERLNRDLERRVAARTKELQEANLLLQQRTRELERLALTDPLTSLFNRRAMDELLRFELKRHARYPSALTVGVVDVDHFKRINTEYLLTGGDEVLKALARLLSGSLREVDSIGRIGGEEFLVIARETCEDGAAHLAERLRGTVEQTPINYDGNAISITVSIGLAIADVGAHVDFDGISRQAAYALNLAKKNGRNRIEICRVRSGSSIQTQAVSPGEPVHGS